MHSRVFGVPQARMFIRPCVGARSAILVRQVLEQRFHHVEKERDELYEKFESTIYDVQQKSGFKNILLERKLQVTDDHETACFIVIFSGPVLSSTFGAMCCRQAINESLEKKESQLSEVRI